VPLASDEVLTVQFFDAASATPTVSSGSVTGAPGASVSFVTPILAGGQHNFTATVADKEGDMSVSSNVAPLTIPLPAPSAITDLAAVITPGS
jgi:hypothetical protein